MADDRAEVRGEGAAEGQVPPTAESFAPEVLKSAYNAFKRRWKLTRLDQES